MLLIETALVVVCLVLALVLQKSGARLFQPFETALASLAARRSSAILIAGGTALALRLAVLPILAIPYAGVHDEFSYLLMADTFAHGRLTNPTHVLWTHFEAVTVIQKPTYCSVFYPAQGMFMALGQLVAGHPFWGVWLSVGLMCAAISWMLQGWTAPYWALLGGLLAAIRLASFSYWANSYFGGAVAAIGGALVLGALPRIWKTCLAKDALIMGGGFFLLATSRPYETLFFSIPVFVSIASWIWRVEYRAEALKRIVLPLGLCLLATAGFLLYYFWRTTGNPFLSPYVVNLRSYFIDPGFPWLPLRPAPHYNHEELRRHYAGFNITLYQLAREHPVFSVIVKLAMLWFFFLGPLLTLPVLALGFVLPYGMKVKDVSPKVKMLAAICVATIIGVLLPVYANPHYAAPITAGFYAFLMMAVSRVRHWRIKGRRAGLILIRGFAASAVLLFLLRVAIPVFHLPLTNSSRPESWASPWYQLVPRQAVEEKLDALPGDHLVLVHYDNFDDPSTDWALINNSADIDDSKIIWAHDMGPQNNELLRYYSTRHVWLLRPNHDPIQLSPCEGPCTSALASGQVPR